MLTKETLERLIAFRDARDWRQFHSFRHLAVSISLEAAELLEFVQWVPDADEARVVHERKAAIGEEIADIAMYLELLARDIGVDIDECVQRKLAINEARYPVEKARGVATKYDRLK